jgi:Carboxypeptidase regulatory-like domain
MRLRAFVVVALLPRFVDAQVADTTHRLDGAIISGIVSDSIARLPLAGAVVQLVAADSPARFERTAIADSLGRFTLRDIPDGHYRLGFFHPMLDSLGVEAPLRDVYVDRNQPVRIDLALPSAAQIKAAICRTQRTSNSGALVFGIVRDARDGVPAAGVTVSGEWVELSLISRKFSRNLKHVTATTGGTGWFAMCNVPTAGTLALLARRGTDSTDLIELQIPPDGFLRRDLYLGPAQTVTTVGTAHQGDSLLSLSRRIHVGEGRLNGTVIAAAGGRSLAGAQVSIADGPQTRTNERGEWTLLDAPAGTRMLEVRALGYYPDRRLVNVVGGAAPIHVALSTLKAVLDTVKITATRLRNGQDDTGFQQRRRMGIGHYITPADVMKFPAVVTSDLFRMVPGVRFGYDDMGQKYIQVRGAFETWCNPAIFLNGHNMSFLTTEDIDAWVHPNEVAGIEIYSEATAPAEFQVGLRGCGSIVIWTK